MISNLKKILFYFWRKTKTSKKVEKNLLFFGKTCKIKKIEKNSIFLKGPHYKSQTPIRWKLL